MYYKFPNNTIIKVLKVEIFEKGHSPGEDRPGGFHLVINDSERIIFDSREAMMNEYEIIMKNIGEIVIYVENIKKI